jgi:hypothetical protein
VRIGDVTGDGRPDIVGVNSGASSVTVFPRNAVGGWDLPVSYATGLGTPVDDADLAVGDVTGDGRADVVVLGRLVSTFTANPRIAILAQQVGGTPPPSRSATSVGMRVRIS